jgi:hypothetical protein
MSAPFRPVVWLLVPALAWAALPARADGMPTPPAAARCTAPDRVLFACNATQGHRILVCGQLPGRVQVQLQGPRHGPLRVPADAADGPKLLRYAQYGRFQLDHVEIGFEHEGTRYALFDHTENGRRQYGLDIVAPGAKVETRLACRSGRQGSLRQLRQHVVCDRDNELNQLDCK